jgi:hypothetical protein
MKKSMEISKKLLLKVNNIFFYSIVNPSLRDEIGIKAVSGLNRDRGWYVWLHQYPGAYDLFTIKGNDENSVNFFLKYYPTLDEPLFDVHSSLEKDARKQFLFEKGVPKEDVRDNQLMDLFTIGRLDVHWEDHLIWLHLVTPLSAREPDQPKKPDCQLAYLFYQIMIRSICLFTKTPPSIVLSRKSSLMNWNSGSSASGPDDEDETIINQFSCAVFPDLPENNRKEEIKQLCNSLDIDLEIEPQEPAQDRWQIEYIEGKTSEKPVFSDLLDEMWWTLPVKGEQILSKEFFI